jgi:hypothetical protein
MRYIWGREPPRPAGKVAVIGVRKVGLVVVKHLASSGKEVWVIESQKRFDYDIIPTFKWYHAAWVKEFGINVLNLREALKVTDAGLRIKDEKGKDRVIEAGTIVLAGPRVSLQEFTSSLEFIGDEVYAAEATVNSAKRKEGQKKMVV